MPLKVIGAGLGRTGTLSLKAALEQLGLKPCHHMQEVVKDPKQIDWFLDASQGREVDWERVFERFEAAVDWPAAAYYKQLYEKFPRAKVVLGTRDPDAWYQSVSETIYTVAPNVPKWLRLIVLPVNKWVQMVEQTIWDNELDGKFEDREYAIAFYNKRIEEVKETIPADKLLIHRAEDGWDPLCEFLEVPVPSGPYPWVNEGAEIKRAVRFLKALRWLPALVLSASFAGFLLNYS